MDNQQTDRIDQSTNTEYFNIVCPYHNTTSSSTNSFWHMDFKAILKIIGFLLVPVMLGIATIVLSVQQTKLNQENRQNDIEIAQQKRKQDSDLADQLEKERLLAAYLHDISTLVLENNVTFDKSSVVSSIIRAKTLTTLLQLDIRRKRQVILFLYETKLIMKNDEYPSINLCDVELDNLDMSLPKVKRSLNPKYDVLRIQLRGVSLVNSSFRFRDLDFSDFSQADLTNSDFTWTQLPHVDFRSALLYNASFTHSTVSKAVFAYANLSQSNLSDEQLSTTLTFQGAVLPNGTIAPLKNLVINGNAEQKCSYNKTISPLGWIVEHGSIIATSRLENTSESNNKCHFSPSSFYNVSAMHQEVDLGDYSEWILNKKALYSFNITFSGIENEKYNMIVNLRHLASDNTVLEKVTICSHPIHDEYCDSESLLYEAPYFTLRRELFSNGKIDVQSTDIEIIFKKRTLNEFILPENNVTVSCDNIGFYIYLSP